MVVRLDGQVTTIENVGQKIKVSAGPHGLLVMRGEFDHKSTGPAAGDPSGAHFFRHIAELFHHARPLDRVDPALERKLRLPLSQTRFEHRQDRILGRNSLLCEAIDFSCACHHREVILRSGNFRFAWVAVHRDQVAGISG
jgi:hypothetical protein